MSYSLTFKINLLHNGNIPITNEEIAASRTICVPLGTGGNPWFVKRHGDEFTLSGREAIYLKNLIQNGLIENVEVVTETVEEVVSQSLSLFAASDFYSDPDISVFPIFLEENRITFSGEFMSFNVEEVFQIIYFAYNTDDGYLYGLGRYDTGAGQIFFFRYIDNSLDYKEIPSLLKISTTNYINDGYDDMYDQGNILSTNIARAIPYTHSRHARMGFYRSDGRRPSTRRRSTQLVLQCCKSN
jgi:hypothetical protein